MTSDPTRSIAARDGWMIALLACLVMLPALGSAYLYDDVPIIVENTRLDDALDPGTFFSTSYWNDAPGRTGLYRPFTLWSLAAERALFGATPRATFAINLLLHVGASVLVLVVLRRAAFVRPVALTAAALFAVHPVHVEVVANGVGRAELGAACFALLALWAHGSAARHREALGWRQLAALLAYLVALGFKESAVMMPALAVVLQWPGVGTDDERPALGRALARAALYVVPLGAFLAMRSTVVPFESIAVPQVMAGAAPWQRLVVAFDVIVRSGAQFLVPITFSADYADYTRLGRDVTPADALMPIAVVAGTIVGAVVAWRRGAREVAIGLVVFLMAVLPTSNLLIAIGTMRGDRLLYLPMLGFALAFAACWRVATRRTALALTAGLVVVCIVRTELRLPAWRSEVALLEATIIAVPGNAPAWARLADRTEAAGAPVRALEFYERAVALYALAGDVPIAVDVNGARLCFETGETDRALSWFARIVERHPEDLDAWLAYGTALANVDRLDAALDALRTASGLAPDRPDIRSAIRIVEAKRTSSTADP